ncbi:MAG: DNA methyltransferase [Alphaproteobacteria bacterium]
MQSDSQATDAKRGIKPCTIFTGDNLKILRGMADNAVDLIYLDPPFNSNRNYKAPIGSEAAGASFKDAWTFEDTDDAWWGEIAEEHPALYGVIDAVGAVGGKGAKAYSIYMAVRLLELRRVLKDTGSIYLHCDPTMSHSLKLVMDAIFGKANFRNEIVWSYSSGGASKKTFAKKHDVILFYSKSEKFIFNVQKEKSYNRGLKPYRFNGVQEFQDEIGWHTLVNMKDVWKINMVGRTSKERTGYPTQKPLELLRRIVRASSSEGDMVLDPFCGCATACIAAQDEGRNWIGVDISDLAFDLVKSRMEKELGMFGIDVIHRKDIPKDRHGKRSKDIKHVLFGKQEGRCNGCGRYFPFNNFTHDHIIPLADGGMDVDDNLQLLCNWCNSKKGKRPMEVLLAENKAQGLNRP